MFLLVVTQLGTIPYTCTTCTSSASPPLPLTSLCLWGYPARILRYIYIIYIYTYIYVYIYIYIKLQRSHWIETTSVSDSCSTLSPRTKNTCTCAASLYKCCDRAEEPEHHPLVRIFNGSGITRAPRKDLFHVINGVLKTTYNSDPTAKSKLGEYATSTPPAVTLRIRNSPPRKSISLLARAIRT